MTYERPKTNRKSNWKAQERRRESAIERQANNPSIKDRISRLDVGGYVATREREKLAGA